MGGYLCNMIPEYIMEINTIHSMSKLWMNFTFRLSERVVSWYENIHRRENLSLHSENFYGTCFVGETLML